MKILCKERFLEARAKAREIYDNSLQDCLNRLSQWEYANPDLQNTTFVHSDQAKLSFRFYQVYEDGSHGISGGIVFWESGKYCDASGKEQEGAHWEIHT